MRHIKKFESFENRPEVMKPLSKLGEVAKSLRFSTQDSTEETIVKPTTQPTTPQEPITGPWSPPVPTEVPKLEQKERPMGTMKSYEEFMFSNPAIAEPDVDVPTAPPDTPVKRPWRPLPKKVPKPGQKEKPMGDYKQMIDRFFGELKNLKDDEEVQQMIKNIHSKYAKA